jgi:hypothetical protein
MKLSALILLAFAGILTYTGAASQNILMNILTQNSGVTNKKGTVILEITVCNTDATDSVPAYKLKPQISIPAAITVISAAGHTLPPGWTITSNDGSTIRLSNGTDRIPAHECRTILIAINGKAVGGPSTISGNLLFSNGIAPGSIAGSPTKGDNPADNTSTTTCEITN